MRVDPMADSVLFDINALIFSRVLKTTQVRECPHFHGANRRTLCAPIGPPPISQPDQPFARGKPSPRYRRPPDATRERAPGSPFGLRQANPGSMLDRMETAAQNSDVAGRRRGPRG